MQICGYRKEELEYGVKTLTQQGGHAVSQVIGRNHTYRKEYRQDDGVKMRVDPVRDVRQKDPAAEADEFTSKTAVYGMTCDPRFRHRYPPERGLTYCHEYAGCEVYPA